MIRCDSFFLEFWGRILSLHDAHDSVLTVFEFEVALAFGVKAREFTQVIACYGFLGIILGIVLKHCNQFVDELKVVLIIKMDERFLPEFFGMHRRPCQMSSPHLLRPFLKRGELRHILIEEFFKSLKLSLDGLINPWFLQKLNDHRVGINKGELLQAIIIELQIVEKHEHDANNLFRVKVVKDFGDILKHVKVVITELGLRVIVVAENPESADHMVGNLRFLDALGLQEGGQGLEAMVFTEFLSELVRLHENGNGGDVGVH